MFRFGPGKGGRHEINMTEGPLLPKILAFSGPLILTGILQLLYNAADVIVVATMPVMKPWPRSLPRVR